MEKIFCLGVMIGAVGGALLIANSYKMRSLVKKSQAEFIEKVNSMMDEKLKCGCEQNSQETKSAESVEGSEKKEKKKEK